MNDVSGDLESEFPPDRSRIGFLGVGGSHDFPNRRDRRRARPFHGHDRSRGDEDNQVIEERLVPVLPVMPVGQLGRDRQSPYLFETKAFALQPADDISHEPALDPVWFDHYESAFISQDRPFDNPGGYNRARSLRRASPTT